MGRLTSLPSAVITDDSALGGAVIQNSLRFSKASGNEFLSRTPSSASNQKTYTISCWYRRSSTTYSIANVLEQKNNGQNYAVMFFRDDDQLEFHGYTSTGGNQYTHRLVTSQVFRDANAWYHIVVAVDTTQSTASDRVKIYVNGSQITNFSVTVNPSQNLDTFFNSTQLFTIGRGQAGSSQCYDGYMAEINFVDGFQLTPSSFGYTEFQTEIWKPKGYFGSYGTNGFRLDFSDNSATTAVTLGKDRSGQGNDFTPNNFSVSAGVNNDSFLESPTAKKEFATLNSNLQTSSSTEYRQGNLAFYTSGSSTVQTRANMSRNSGKWYAEFTLTTFTVRSGSYPYIGVAQAENFSNTWTGDSGTAYQSQGGIWRNQSNIESGYATYAAGDVISVAINLDSSPPQVWWAKNGSYIRSGANPSTLTAGVNIEPASPSGTYTFTASLYANPGQWDANFGQRPFAHSIPTGFKTLSTDNFSINTPSLIRPQKQFDTIIYSGNGSSPRAIGGLEFRPDFVWLKNRNSTNWHRVQNSIAGPHNTMYSNSTNSEAPNESNGHVDSFTDDGFIVDDASGSAVNGGSNTFVAWCWKGGGNSNTFNIDGVGYASASAAGLNTGTITPTGASINTEGGFSVITYTANGTAGATIPHGLGKKPGWIIIKCRSNTDNWMVYHHNIDTSSPEDYYLELNAAGTRVNSTVMLNDTAPTSTLVTVQNDNSVNGGSRTYIMHSWAEIPGYSKFGQFTGNGNADGPYIECGFRPSLVIFKNTTTSEAWSMFDNKRDPHNPVAKFLRPNTNNADTSGSNDIDFLSNGIKVRTSNNPNTNNSTYVFMAFAEQIGDSPYHTDTNAR